MLADTELELIEEEDALCDIDADADEDPMPLAVNEVERTRGIEELDRTGHGYPLTHSGRRSDMAPASVLPGPVCLSVKVLK